MRIFAIDLITYKRKEYSLEVLGYSVTISVKDYETQGEVYVNTYTSSVDSLFHSSTTAGARFDFNFVLMKQIRNEWIYEKTSSSSIFEVCSIFAL